MALRVNDQANAAANYRKAIAVWQKNINDIDDKRHFSEGCYFTGYAYKRLKEYPEAIGYFQTLLDKTPDFDRAWSAQYAIADCWDELCQKKELSFEEAKPLVLEACAKLAENYPDSPAKDMADALAGKYENN